MLVAFIVYTLVAAISPQVLPGIRISGWGSAAGVAVMFGVVNLLLGWFIKFLTVLISLPAILVSLGLFALAIPTLVNAVLLRITAAVLPSFRLDGWIPALGMGFLFALAGWISERIS